MQGFVKEMSIITDLNKTFKHVYVAHSFIVKKDQLLYRIIK